MHPDLGLYLVNQRAIERRAAACTARLVKDARKRRRNRRTRRGLNEVADAFVVPPIPDYIDTPFAEHGSTRRAF